MHYASLCAIARDEDHALAEWADYHLRLGFEHLYVFDNNSRNSIRQALAEFVDLGLVTVIDFPLARNQQLSAYAAALAEFGRDTVWLGFIDLDEFVVPKMHPDIRDLLDAYLPYGGLAAHWRMFGPDGHRRRPAGGVVRNYTSVVGPDNGADAHVKSIVRPQTVASVASPHHFIYRPGWHCVNEDTVPVLGPRSYHTARTIQINHYYYKSFEDFVDKNRRGLATQARSGRTEREANEFEDFARKALTPGERDETALRLVKAWAEHGPATLRDVKERLLRASDMAFAEFFQAVAACLAAGDLSGALAELRICLRYHDTPRAWLLAARLHLLRKDREQSLRAISRLLQDLEAPCREEGYRCLAEYYQKFGEPEKADRILAELQRAELQAAAPQAGSARPEPGSCS